MKSWTWILTSFIFLTGCAKGVGEVSSAVQTTWAPKTPVVSQHGQYQVTDGVTKLLGMDLGYDSAQKSMRLTGKMTLIPTGSRSTLNIDVKLQGTVDESGSTVLRATNPADLPPGLQMGAKATCLGTGDDCSSSFVDIYIKYEGKIYHHQVESMTSAEQLSPAHNTIGQDPAQTSTSQKTDGQGAAQTGGNTQQQGQNAQPQNQVAQQDPQANGQQQAQTANDVVAPVAPTKNIQNTDREANPSGPYVAPTKTTPKAAAPAVAAGAVKAAAAPKKTVKQKATEEKAPAPNTVSGGPITKQVAKTQPVEAPKIEVPKKAAAPVVTAIAPKTPAVAPVKKDVVTPVAPAKVSAPAPKVTAPEVKPAADKIKADTAKADDDDDLDENDDVPHDLGPYVSNPEKDIEDIFGPGPDKDVPPAKDAPAKLNQAVGAADTGHLENASNLLDYQKAHGDVGFQVMRPERETSYGTGDMVSMIAHLGAFSKKNVPGYVLEIGDLSHKNGGAWAGHKSHANGMDADIGLYSSDSKKQKNFSSAISGGKPVSTWMAEEQWELFKYIAKSKRVDRIFLSKILKNTLCQIAIKDGQLKPGQKDGEAYEVLHRIIPWPGHENHFHLRLKCSTGQPRCRQMADPAPNSGCF